MYLNSYIFLFIFFWWGEGGCILQGPGSDSPVTIYHVNFGLSGLADLRAKIALKVTWNGVITFQEFSFFSALPATQVNYSAVHMYDFQSEVSTHVEHSILAFLVLTCQNWITHNQT